MAAGDGQPDSAGPHGGEGADRPTGPLPSTPPTAATPPFGHPVVPSFSAFARAMAVERAGDYIDVYKLLEVIGEGGFGTVWLAERREPMVLRVALKIIKAGMDTARAMARFEQERQALAIMDHPCIAKIFDAGATPTGRPYFVMEFVPGEPVTSYCDRLRLTTRQRLELFIPICAAIEHAHQRGVIHRDIKPSNILVSITDGKPIPKVIDFGVAKATDYPLTDKTIFTEVGQLLGTPEYMSPEQAEMGATKIDGRTDVYSLGVVLYELLAGTLPFDPESLRSAGYDEIRRIIREVDPPRPSTRLTSLADDTATGVARARQVERKALAAQLRERLEWIPLMAMRKDRTERYDSPASLARDIENYLNDRPLVASPESALHRFRRWARRRRRTVAAAIGFFAVLVGGTTGTVWGIEKSRQTLAWLSLESGLLNCRAYLQRVDPATLELGPARSLGTTPLAVVREPPGQFRITVVSADGSRFAEFSTGVVEPGREVGKRILVTASPPRSTPPETFDRGVLAGPLAPADAQPPDMILIPAGQYMYGEPVNGSPRTVRLDAFWIDKCEVSNEAYRAFVDATHHTLPEHWRAFGYDAKAADLPVVGVTRDDAEAFARWCGKRLPTAPEWEAAVRGPAGALHPWIEDPGPSLDRLELEPSELASRRIMTLEDMYAGYRKHAVPVASHDPLTSVGELLHVFGNVEEMTASFDPRTTSEIDKGRNWADPPRKSTLATTFSRPRGTSAFERGFRCARSASPPVPTE